MTSAADRPPSAPHRFATTHWSLVLAAKQTGTLSRTDALELLCSSYWYPLYAFVRMRGHSPDDASDLTQAFFTRLVEKDYLQSVDQRKGRFRSFLLASLKHFLSNERDYRTALKRGGAHRIISWDRQDAERRYAIEPAHSVTPERLFEKSWALSVIRKALDDSRKEYAAAGKQPLFDALEAHVAGVAPQTYSEIAGRLGMSEGAVKMAVLRLRRRFGELLRREIARTVSCESEVDEEISELFEALGT